MKKTKKKYSNFPQNGNYGIPQFPTGGTLSPGFDPATMNHTLAKGENPYTNDQLLSMGYQVGNSTGEYITPTGDYAFYKPQYTTSGITASSIPTNSNKPKLAWPTRTDYSAGSVGPRYKQGFKNGGRVLPKYLTGGRKEDPIAPAAITSDPNSNNPYTNQFNYSEGAPSNAQYAQYGASTVAGIGAYGASQAQNSNLPTNQRQGKAINAGVDATASSLTPWYGYAKGASNIGKNAIAHESTTDPNTGETMEIGKTRTGQAWRDTFTPMHETAINAFTNEGIGAGLQEVFTGGVHNTLDNYFNGTDRKKFDAMKKAETTANTPAYVSPKDYRQDAVWQRASNHYGDQGEFAMGGVNPMDANAEIEKQEVVQYPNGMSDQADGPSHEQGGVPVNLPGGSRIFSDRLKIPGMKKTFAKLAEKFKSGKEEKILTDDKANITAKSTAQLIADIKQKKLDQLFQAQESLKQSKVQSYAKKLGVELPQAGVPQMRNGGILPKFSSGGKYVSGVWIPDGEYSFTDQVNADNREYTNDDLVNATNDLGRASFSGRNLAMTAGTAREAANYRVPNSDESMEAMNIPRGNAFGQNTQDINTSNTPSLNNIQGYQGDPSEVPQRQRRNYNEYIEPTVNTLLQNSGNIADLVMTKFGKKYDKENSGQLDPRFVKPNTVDATEAIRDAQRGASMSKNALKSMVGGNAGAFMANNTNINSQRAMDVARLRQDNRNTNANILNQADQMNTGIANQFAVHNQGTRMNDKMNEQQNKARSEDIARQAVRGIGTNSSAAYKDYKAGKMDQNTAGMISSMFTNYKLDMNNPDHWKWIFKTLNNKGE